MRFLLLAIAVVLSFSPTAAQVPANQIQPEVDRIFARWTKDTPGCAVGADVNGTAVVRAAYGMADLEHDVPITLDTIFEAGSVSKQFTAAAVLLLEQDGKLSLDDKVRKYIPELPDVAAGITIRQMLNHTAGLREWASLVSIAGWPRTTRVYTQAYILDLISRQRMLNFEPGTQWSYSNTGYNLAAILVGRVSGMSFADFTKTRIFDPLGMRNTSWRDDHNRIVKRRAIAYSGQSGRFSTLMPFGDDYGNGGLLTTVGDLLKWNANFANPVVGGASFVAALERRGRLNDGRENEYALGLYVRTRGGHRVIDHSGGTGGYSAHLVRYPDDHLSVAVMCNINPGPSSFGVQAIADLLLPPQPTRDLPSSLPLAPGEGSRFSGLYRSLKPDSVTASRPVSVVTISAEANGLVSSNFGPLLRLSDTRFAAEPRGVVFEFETGVRLRVADRLGASDTYERVDPWRPGLQGFTPLVGSYTSDELQVTVSLALEGDRLLMRRGPGRVETLTPVFSDGFSFAQGWLVVRRDSSGRVTGFSVDQEGVWDLRFSRQPD
jgi:CubicO group peptidase (beta-lactamase class C family)